MPRVRVNLQRRTPLNYLARVHHIDPVGVARHHAQIVRNHNQRHPQVLGQRLHQLQNLRLDGHIQRRRRLVRDNQTRVATQRHGDHHPLPHSPAELVRVLPDPPLRVGNPHLRQQVNGVPPRLIPGLPHMQLDGLRQLPVQRQHGIQRSHRLLEHHRHLGAPDPAHIVHINLEDVLTLKDNLPAHRFPRRIGNQPHQRQRAYAFAAAALPYQPQGFAGQYLIGDVVNSLHYPFVGKEVGLQIFDFQQGIHRRAPYIRGDSPPTAPADATPNAWWGR